MLPAHGGLIHRPARAIDEALLFYEVRIQRVERALRKAAARGGSASAWEVWQILFSTLDPITQMRTRMMMVIGALDELESTSRVAADRREDGALVFASCG